MPAKTFEQILKENPYHAADGKFTTPEGAGSGGGSQSFNDAAFSGGEFDPFEALMWMADHPESSGGSSAPSKEPEPTPKPKRENPKSQLPEAALNKCKEIEAQSVKRDTEQMTIIDKDGNVIAQVEGKNDNVVLTPGMAHKAEARTITHNHPQEYGGTFSQADLAAFTNSLAPPKAIRAVGKEGTYHLERGNAEHKQVLTFRKAAESACQTAMMEISQANKMVDRDVRDGLMTPAEGSKRKAEIRKDALSALSKRYEELADENGLIYYFEPAGETAKKSAIPTGTGVLVLRDGKVLTGTRIERASRGQICGPGGHIEPGETPEEAAKREAYEEFGIICNDLQPLGTQNGGRRYGTSAVFLCTDYTGTPRTDEEEMTNPKWLTPRQIGALDAFPPFRESLGLLLDDVRKFNPYHDARGRFSSANGATSMTIRTSSAAGQKAIANIKEREKAKMQAPGGGSGSTSEADNGNQETRGHLEFMDNKTAVENTMKECGVAEQEAKDMVRDISAYADGYAYEMRNWQQTGKTGGEMTTDEAKSMEANVEKFIKNSPKWEGGEIYRGISLKPEDTHKLLDQISAGEPLDMKGTSSWSSDRETADDFGQMTAMDDDVTIIFKAPGTKKGTSIDHISEFSQSEVLVSKDARWDVKTINGSVEDGYLEIELEERP